MQFLRRGAESTLLQDREQVQKMTEFCPIVHGPPFLTSGSNVGSKWGEQRAFSCGNHAINSQGRHGRHSVLAKFTPRNVEVRGHPPMEAIRVQKLVLGSGSTRGTNRPCFFESTGHSRIGGMHRNALKDLGVRLSR